ncbi:MAG: hypothetical protein ACLFN7_05355 [Candidatus Acetothermia bacterium]
MFLDKKRLIVFTLVFLLAISLLNPFGREVAGGEVITSTDEFISTLEAEYGDIVNFSARLDLTGTESPVSIQVLAVTEPRCLRVEYLSPERLEGQFFLLEENSLYQYMPGRNLIIKKSLEETEVPIEATNLTPEYLLELLRSDDLEINLIGIPVEMKRVNHRRGTSDLGATPGGGVGPGASLAGQELPPGNGPDIGTGDLFGEYTLEIIPKSGEEYGFSRQVIQIDRGDFLPRELVTYFPEESEPVYTTVEDVETNIELDLEEVRRLPEDAEVIEK